MSYIQTKLKMTYNDNIVSTIALKVKVTQSILEHYPFKYFESTVQIETFNG